MVAIWTFEIRLSCRTDKRDRFPILSQKVASLVQASPGFLRLFSFYNSKVILAMKPIINLGLSYEDSPDFRTSLQETEESVSALENTVKSMVKLTKGTLDLAQGVFATQNRRCSLGHDVDLLWQNTATKTTTWRMSLPISPSRSKMKKPLVVT
jgi:hypothetical protein